MKGSQGLSDAPGRQGFLFFFSSFRRPAVLPAYPSLGSGSNRAPLPLLVLGESRRPGDPRGHRSGGARAPPPCFLAGRRGGSDKAGHWVSRSVISGVDARGEEGGQELAPTSASGPVQMHYGSPEAAYEATSEELHTRDGGLSVCSSGDRHRRQ